MTFDEEDGEPGGAWRPKFAVDAVLLGHTHSARWKQALDLAFVNSSGAR